jgi:hypothetical protein
MDTIMTVLAWLEAHPVLTQASAITLGAVIALVAATIAYKGIKKQIANSLALERRSRAHEIKAIYGAFAADLDALKKSLDGFHSALIDEAATEGRGISKSVFLGSRNMVWESCAPKIGVLDPNHAANIIETYRFIDAMTGRARELDMEDATHRAELAYFIDQTTKQIEVVLKGLPFRPDRENAGPK